MRRKNVLLTLGATFACAMAFCLPCFAADGTMMATQSVNVREGAGMSYARVGELSQGKSITVTGIEGDWYKVKYDGKDAYISVGYLTLDGADKNGDLPDGKSVPMTAKISVNMRDGAGMEYDVIGWIGEGKTGDAIGCVNGWMKIKYNGKIGYVYAKNLEFAGGSSEKKEESKSLGETTVNVSALNVRKGPAPEYDRIGGVYYGEKYQVYESKDGWYRIDYKGQEGWICAYYCTGGPSESKSSESSSSKTSIENITINISSLNVRKGPGVSYDAIGYVSEGETYTAYDEKNGWYRIDFKGSEGWVSGYYCKKGGSSSSSSSSEIKGDGETMYATTYVNMRAGASNDAEIIDVVTKGAAVQALNVESSGWVHVKYNNKTGYVYKSFLTK